jgi:hypothetical protein
MNRKNNNLENKTSCLNKTLKIKKKKKNKNIHATFNQERKFNLLYSKLKLLFNIKFQNTSNM